MNTPWSRWKPLTTPEGFSDLPHWSGAASYELAVASPIGDLDVVFRSQTQTLRKDLARFAAGGAHLADEIMTALRSGASVWYRSSQAS